MITNQTYFIFFTGFISGIKIFTLYYVIIWHIPYTRSSVIYTFFCAYAPEFAKTVAALVRCTTTTETASLIRVTAIRRTW
jgi:hypothetical protein